MTRMARAPSPEQLQLRVFCLERLAVEVDEDAAVRGGEGDVAAAVVVEVEDLQALDALAEDAAGPEGTQLAVVEAEDEDGADGTVDVEELVDVAGEAGGDDLGGVAGGRLVDRHLLQRAGVGVVR